ncbi:hypothetical protein JCM16303_000711 [Sporobolomyces ruberrimus]
MTHSPSRSLNSPSSGSSSSPSIEPTHRVLSLYYPHLRTLSSLFKGQLVKDKDPQRFKQFLEECVVGTIDQKGFDQTRVLDVEDRSIGMSEIMNQVLQRIFTSHSVEYQKARKAGLPAFTSPKNVLACGHRLTTVNNERGMGLGRVQIGTGPAFECVFTNTLASSMTSSKDWSTLLSRVGPDSIIKLLSSPSIALFQPLQNGCYVQISGNPVVELDLYKEKEKEVENGKKKGKGRKVHVRACKKRGKRKKRSLQDEDGSEEELEQGNATKKAKERGLPQEDRMEVDSTKPPSATFVEPTQEVTSPRKKARLLGPSISAPSLLVTTDRIDRQSQPSQFPRTAAQSQLQVPSASAMNGSNTQLNLATSLIKSNKGGSTTKIGIRQKKGTLNSNNSIVFSRHRIYHARMSRTKQGKPVYGLSPKPSLLTRLRGPIENRTDILSRLSQDFTLPTSAFLPTIPTNPQTTSQLYAPARHLSKYVFPRQFGFDNVFESEKVNLSIRVRPDHEDRELEIKKLGTTKTPSRLKRQIVPLLNRMIVLHNRCNYRKMLGIKCPSKVSHKALDEEEKKSLVTDLMSEAPASQFSRTNLSTTLDRPPVVSQAVPPPDPSSASSDRVPDSQLPDERQGTNETGDGTQGEGESESLRPMGATTGFQSKPKLAEYACTPYEVESYVKAIVRDVVPRAFWGSDRNAKLVMKQISQYLRMRRFETISLHSLLQGFSILDCDWLDPSSNFQKDGHEVKKTGSGGTIPSVELEKRKEVLAEFFHWLFDSLITDIVRTSFYVTDSATHQNRPLYFRQDDWAALTAPLLESLGNTVFERVPDNQVIALERQPRELGYSYVRLLPKEAGVRPIVNLARRRIQTGLNGEKEIGQPINKILRSVFDVLTFESKRKPHLVGSLVTNPQEIYAKLKDYKTRLLKGRAQDSVELPELYFVKVDVKACFDTIKQEKLLALVEEILSETLYYIQKYSQVVSYSGKTARIFKRQACGDDDLGSFKELAMKLAENLHDVVLTDQVRYDDVDREKLMGLLKEHITTNLVKVNGHTYRQRDGIPQGSVLSSLLCSLFYGDMENTRLSFTRDDQSLMVRYVDDFLFVTTKKHLAVRFLRTMNDGIPEYGCFVSTEKRLTNFDVSLDDGEIVPPLTPGEDFGYCGLAIDTKTLDIKMNLQLQMNREIVNQLTVQRYRKPGEAFLSAMFRAVKVRAHSMYTDTTFNSLSTVYSNIYQALLIVALKYRAYIQEWCGSLRGKVSFFWSALRKIVKYEYSSLLRQVRGRRAVKLAASFDIEELHVTWLGYHAFHRVLSQSGASFSPLIRLLMNETKTLGGRQLLPVLKEIVGDEKNRIFDKNAAKRRL